MEAYNKYKVGFIQIWLQKWKYNLRSGPQYTYCMHWRKKAYFSISAPAMHTVIFKPFLFWSQNKPTGLTKRSFLFT